MIQGFTLTSYYLIHKQNMRNARLGTEIAINNCWNFSKLRHADHTAGTLILKPDKENLRSQKGKEESAKAKTINQYSEIDGEEAEVATDFIFLAVYIYTYNQSIEKETEEKETRWLVVIIDDSRGSFPEPRRNNDWLTDTLSKMLPIGSVRRNWVIKQ